MIKVTALTKTETKLNYTCKFESDIEGFFFKDFFFFFLIIECHFYLGLIQGFEFNVVHDEKTDVSDQIVEETISQNKYLSAVPSRDNLLRAIIKQSESID